MPSHTKKLVHPRSEHPYAPDLEWRKAQISRDAISPPQNRIVPAFPDTLYGVVSVTLYPLRVTILYQ